MKIVTRLPIVSLFIVFITVGHVAYGAPPPPSAGSDPCLDPSCIPLDGGLSYLLFAAISLGVNKLRKSFKR